MPDEPNGHGQQQDDGETPPATGVQQPTGQPGPPSGVTPPTATPPADKTVPVAELAEERRQRKALAKRLQELEAAEQARQDANKSEAERLLDRANRAEQAAEAAQRELQAERIGRAIRAAAKTAGFRDEDDAVMAIQSDQIELDTDGTPVKGSVEQAVKAIAQAKPHWLRAEGERTTGSKFAGDGRRSAKPDEDRIRSMFPALGGSRARQG